MWFQELLPSRIVLLGAIVAPLALAQIRSATVTGTVTAASGAVVAGAQVEIVNQATNIGDKTKTTDAGLFTFPYLQAGLYTVSVNMAGFSPYRETEVTV